MNAKYYCCEDMSKIENYDKMLSNTSQVWDCHHRLETHNSDGERRLVDLSIKELQALDMYYDRPASELIFLTHSEHCKLHHVGNNDLYKKISDSRTGKPHPHKGDKGRVVTKETRDKISKKLQGRHLSDEVRQKLSDSHKGKTVSWAGKKRGPYKKKAK